MDRYRNLIHLTELRTTHNLPSDTNLTTFFLKKPFVGTLSGRPARRLSLLLSPGKYFRQHVFPLTHLTGPISHTMFHKITHSDPACWFASSGFATNRSGSITNNQCSTHQVLHP